MSDRDEELELLIHTAWHALMDAACRESKVTAFNEMRELVKQRSPEQIARMEIERGLRAP